MSSKKEKKTKSVITSLKKKNKKISRKLLIYIIPVIIVTVLVLVNISASIAKNKMRQMARETLESSISNQADNIEAWLTENLTYFQTAKHTVESVGADEELLVPILDSFYGYNSNAPEGFYIGTTEGKLYKATESTMDETDITGSTWFKQGLSRIAMAYGTAYTNDQGETVISATGILNDGSDVIKVMGADVTLNKITIIVNSGVKMSGASSFLVDTNDYRILAHRDSGLVGTTLSESSSDALLAGAASSIIGEDLSSKEISSNMVAFKEVPGTDWVLVSYIPTAVILQVVTQMGVLLFMVGGIAIILIVIIVLFVIRKVIAPLGNISGNISSMTAGDFTIEVDSSSDDEIGIMGSKLSEFVASMRSMLSHISEESDKLGGESDNSARVSKIMFDASQAQSEAMDQLNQTVDQLATAVNDIAANATTLAQVVADTRDNSDKAGASMKETVEISQKGREDMEKVSLAMNDISKANEELVESINKVGQASEEITNIVGMIGEIAEETNLLSLNASIEAARAGDAGKGFAVVATEIGKLAQTSADSAQNISALINDVRELIDKVVGEANDSAESIKANSSLINIAVETFDKIYVNIQESNGLIDAMLEDVQKVDDVATNVAAISEEQAASADEILATSENMVEMAKNITQSSQDVADNSHELAQTSQTLTSYVQKFKI
ncbi:methyl-accepting chemotaxis protein [Butyrivibrio sp. MC2013]|uniref:methyl-accepting chemotaxis protein n=1 Tax=Butyrivibrio sp. MC2013 TaxID=1280686 RepID=UPI00040F93BE|nr:methyl-accepting chemotaxis protein [Butyrivibrio sp. MC2013]